MTTILAIDDQIDNLTTIKAVIKNGLPKCKLITALSGKEGIKLAKKELPDTILLDIIMPEMDGYEVCKRLKEDEATKNIPVVMITAIKTDSEGRVKALNLGADAFLSKPIDPNELIAQINVMLRIKAAEDKLRQEKDQLDTLVSKKKKEVYFQNSVLSNVSNPIISLDMDYNITNWSAGAEELYGWKEKEVIGKKVKEILLIEYPNETREETINIILTKGKFVGEVIHHKKNGERLNIMGSVSLIRDSNGKNIGITAIGHDITEQKAIKEELKISEEKFRNYVETSQDLIWECDKEGRFVYLNPAWEKVTGYKLSEMLGKPFTDLTIKEEIEKNMLEFTRHLEGGFVKGFPSTYISKQGSEIYLIFNAIPLYDSDKKIIGTQGSAYNNTESKLAEKNLRMSEERFDLAMNASKDGLYDWNLITNEIYYSPGWKMMLGYEDSELPNDFSIWENLTKPEDTQKSWEMQQKLINKEIDRFELEFKMKHKDGYWIDVLSRAEAVYDKSDKAIRIVGTHVDITERKSAENELIKLTTLNKMILDTAGEGIYGLDLDGNTTFVNPSAIKMIGWEYEEILGKNQHDILHHTKPDGTAYDSSECPIYAAYKDGEVHHVIDEEFWRKDGRSFPVEYISAPLRNEQGELVGAVVTFNDITERKLAEEENNRNQNLQRILLDNLPVVTLILKKHSREIVACNKLAREMGAVIGKTCHGSLFNCKHECQFCLASDMWETNEPILIEVEHVSRYWKSYWVPYTDDLYIHYLWDITDSKETEQNLVKALENATESDRLKSTFLATMSHELRTPLNAVIGFSGLINEQTPVSEVVQFSKTINKSGNHLLSIVEDIFDITLIEAGEINLKKEDVKLSSLLQNVHQIAKAEQQKTKKNHLNLSLTIKPEYEDLVINTDSSKLKQILINLLKNALKFTHKGHINFGFIIENQENNPRIKFFVEDTGIGVSKNKQEFIFDVFRQGDESNTKVYGGTGIGLSISKKLTEILGGEIWQESEDGKGSTFYFTHPFTVVQESKSIKNLQLKAVKEGLNKFANKTILVVEDDKASYEYLKVILERQEINTLKANNGEEAIKYCKENPSIDLVLMDINMPVMNGFLATKAIKKFKPDLPIIAQTAYAIAGDKEKALEAGCDDYISKPINKKELLEKIENCLSKN